MKRSLYTMALVSAALLLASCDTFRKKGGGEADAGAEASLTADEGLEYMEPAKAPLPCSKETLSAAWKQIAGSTDAPRGKGLDYRQHTPTLFLSTDLDGDGIPEVLLRGDAPYAAVYSYAQDTLHLITFVDHPQIGLGITPDGAIVRSGTSRDGSFRSQFIRLDNSLPSATGETREKFSVHNGQMVSGNMQYFLQADSAMAEVGEKEYKEAAPRQEATFFEDIDGWEDFRKP